MSENQPQKNTIESTRVAMVIRARLRNPYLDSYTLAAGVIRYVPGYAEATYVEGFIGIWPGDRPIEKEYAWIERAGEIIDPRTPTQELLYFPGLRIEGKEALVRAIRAPRPDSRTPKLPLFYRHGFGGNLNKEFYSARQAAYKELHGITLPEWTGKQYLDD